MLRHRHSYNYSCDYSLATCKRLQCIFFQPQSVYSGISPQSYIDNNGTDLKIFNLIKEENLDTAALFFLGVCFRSWGLFRSVRHKMNFSRGKLYIVSSCGIEATIRSSDISIMYQLYSMAFVLQGSYGPDRFLSDAIHCLIGQYYPSIISTLRFWCRKKCVF